LRFGSKDRRDTDRVEDAHRSEQRPSLSSLPIMRPKVFVKPAPIAKISSISNRFVAPVGFSKGCAELTLKTRRRLSSAS
jgi:hypothetical protein